MFRRDKGWVFRFPSDRAIQLFVQPTRRARGAGSYTANEIACAWCCAAFQRGN